MDHFIFSVLLKENVGEFFLSFSETFLKIKVVKSEELKDKLQTTIEKEADFLRKVTTAKNQEVIVHLEFQVSDEKDMVLRMQEYFAILRKKYRLPVKQLVIYVGEKPPKMRTTLQDDELFLGFGLLNLREVDYLQWLNSEVPEEIMLAILSNYDRSKAPLILDEIINKLHKLSKSEITLKKYIRQLTTLARLRNLTTETQQTLNDMALTYDIEKDAFYQTGLKKGMEKGIKQGIEKGEQRGEKKGMEKATTKMIIGLLKSEKLSLQEIADIAHISLEQVKAIAEQNL